MARAFHTDDRTFSNFQPAELVKLCGVPMGRWPLYVMKELLDNATAALEEFGIDNPMVTITVKQNELVVSENGPGITDEALDHILDFTKFGGSNRHHKLPTRGAQGNALMTIVGIATTWGGQVVVQRPCGPSIALEVTLDTVRQSVDVERREVGRPGRSSVSVTLPELPWKRGGADLDEIVELVKVFTWFNPHVTFMVKDKRDGISMDSVPREDGAKPALPGGYDCGHVQWFTTDEFADRLAADVRARPDTDLGAWMSEFLKSKQHPHKGVSIGDMVSDDRTSLVKFASGIKSKVADASQSPNVQFTPIGRNRLGDALEEMGGDKNSYLEYHTVRGTFSCEAGHQVPFLVEAALLQMPEGVRRAPTPVFSMNRTVMYGSPSFDSIEWREKVRGPWHTARRAELSYLARAYQIDVGKTPAALIVHVTCPSPGYSGYGKQSFDTTWLAEPLSECLERVTLAARKERAGEARRRREAQAPREKIRTVLFRILPEIIDTNTEGGRLPIMIRQLYYATRGVWAAHHHKPLQYGTFCAYVDLYEQAIGRMVCYRDPRGTLIEPHSGRELRLGTDAVNRYNPKKWEGHTIIFVEKEGFAHALKAYKVTKRWDAIVVGSKGFAVESCREVLQKYRKLLGDMVKIICLHDADPAGYMIGYDLATNLPRFGDNVDVQVIDVGLTMEDAWQMDLQDEPFDLKKTVWSMVRNMRKHMIRDPNGMRRPLLEPRAWDMFMPNMYRDDTYPHWANRPQGRRVELNAMPPRVFIDWLEEHLEANECRKVRPPDDIVDDKLRSARENAVRNEVGQFLMKMMGEDAVFEVMKELGVPAYDLDSVLEGRPEQHWEYLVKRAGETGADFNAAVERAMRRKFPGMFAGAE